MESHRLSEVHWSKFSRNISVELALDPRRRKHATDFLKVCRADYDGNGVVNVVDIINIVAYILDEESSDE